MSDVVRMVEIRSIRPDGTVIHHMVIPEYAMLSPKPYVTRDGWLALTDHPDGWFAPPWISQYRLPGEDWIETDRRDA